MQRVFVTGGSGFIGTNLIDSFNTDQVEVSNYDCKPTLKVAHKTSYVHGSILDADGLVAAMRAFKPDAIVHLAARCDLAGESIEAYRANTQGVANVISAANRTSSVSRILFASSRYVHANESQPEQDDQYSPFTLYGASKVEGEKLVRSSSLDIPWLIVRPTSIWGPWFDIPYKGFFQAVRRGLYIHPGREKLYKSYGYVGNAVHQIRRFLTVPSETVHGRTFYLADYTPIEIREMAETIRRHFGAPPVRAAPIAIMKPLAAMGDIMRKLGWYNPPLTSFRLNNLRCQMVYDLSRTAAVVGELPYSVESGVAHTVEWMQQHG
jgi:nucleoside-diphosphate-sugar epimerase